MDLVNTDLVLDLLQGGNEAHGGDDSAAANAADTSAPPDDSGADAGQDSGLFFDFTDLMTDAPPPAEETGAATDVHGALTDCFMRIVDPLPPDLLTDYFPDGSDPGQDGNGDISYVDDGSGDLIWIDWIPPDDGTGDGSSGDDGTGDGSDWGDDWGDAGNDGSEGDGTDNSGTGDSSDGDTGTGGDGPIAVHIMPICVLYAHDGLNL